MYFVHYKTVIGYNLCKFHTLEDAKNFIKDLAEKGAREFHLSKELPIKLEVEVKI